MEEIRRLYADKKVPLEWLTVSPLPPCVKIPACMDGNSAVPHVLSGGKTLVLEGVMGSNPGGAHRFSCRM
jgi:hypothetical protein